MASRSAVELKLAYRDKLGDDPRARLIILTPDSGCPTPLVDVVADPESRVVWVNFVKLTEAFREVLDDEDEPASERERYLVRELIALFRLDGLLDDLDTVIVGAKRAYPAYLNYSSYICQPNRPIRNVARMGFYTGKEIKVHVPRILGRCQDVPLTYDTVEALRSSSDAVMQGIAEVIARNLDDEYAHTPGNHDVYWLSPPSDDNTLVLSAALPWRSSGAFTMNQSYVDSSKLRSVLTFPG